MKRFALVAGLAAFSAVSFAQPAGATHNYFVTGNVSITDNNSNAPATMQMAITQNVIIRRIWVDVMIKHTWQGDLTISLITPSNNALRLITRPGGSTSTAVGFSADNIGNFAGELTAPTVIGTSQNDASRAFYFCVGAPNGNYAKITNGYVPGYAGTFANTSTGTANVAGEWNPETNLDAALAGTGTAGVWGLRVSDSAAGDTGFIRRFSIHVEAVPEPATMAALGLGLAGIAARRRRNRK